MAADVEAMRIDRPIFVVGSSRSGTWMMHRTLGRHPDIRMHPLEQKWLWKYGHYDHYNDRLTAEDVTDKAIAYIHRRFRRYQRKSGADKRIGEKTNCNALRLTYVQRVFPDAKFIHMLRDGRAAAVSSRQYWLDPSHFTPQYGKIWQVPFLQKVRLVCAHLWRKVKGLKSQAEHTTIPWGPCFPGIREAMKTHSPIEVCGMQWRELVETARREGLALGTKHYYECRYERFCADPKAVIREIEEFLEIPRSEELETWVGENIHMRALDSWRSKINDEDMARLMKQIEPCLREFGFLDGQ